MRKNSIYPTEDSEHMALAQYLDARFTFHGWYHAANERIANVQYHEKLKRKGTKKGFPDFLIFEPVKIAIPGWPNTYLRTYSGMAIELKRQHGRKETPEQNAWLQALKERDWFVCVAYGAQDAKDQIEEIYGKWRNG